MIQYSQTGGRQSSQDSTKWNPGFYEIKAPEVILPHLKCFFNISLINAFCISVLSFDTLIVRGGIIVQLNFIHMDYRGEFRVKGIKKKPATEGNRLRFL